MSQKRTWTLPLVRQIFKDLRHVVEGTLHDFPKDVRDAACMVAAELVSNAIQYGVSVPAAPEANVTLTVTEGQVQIAVSNGICAESVGQELQNWLLKIAQVDSREKLYMSRLQQMLEDHTQTGKLGLYRIGFEGQFELACTYTDQVLTVIATRGIL